MEIGQFLGLMRVMTWKNITEICFEGFEFDEKMNFPWIFHFKLKIFI